MRSFVSRQDLVLQKKRVRRYTILFGALCLLTLLTFAAECLLTRTGNAAAMLKAAYISMIAMGAACIAFRAFALAPAKRKENHLESLLSGEAAEYEGRFSLTDESFRIPKSVRVRIALLDTGKETLRLNLDEEWVRFAPPEGSAVRLQAVRKFITGMEAAGDTAAPERRTAWTAARAAGILRRILSLLPAVVLWSMAVLVFGGFVFNQITDTDPKHKIVIYADCELADAPELAEKLEQALNGAVRMVKIHPFSYAMFDTARIRQGDLYIVPDSRSAEYRDWFAPGEGTVMYDPADGTAAAGAAWFRFTREGEPPEIYRLYTGGASVHLEDGLARRAAELLLSLAGPDEEENP